MKTDTPHTHVDQSKVKPQEPKVQELIAECKALVLATVNEDGSPLVSTVPYSRIGNAFQVFVSFMAGHTRNLRDRKKVSFMFVEDESKSKQIFALHRLTLSADAVLVEKNEPLYEEAINDLRERHGKIVDVLAGMDDFILFNFVPQKGSYVNGFGSAYMVDENLEIVTHRKGIHGSHNAAEAK